jgi:hypothetical protein
MEVPCSACLVTFFDESEFLFGLGNIIILRELVNADFGESKGKVASQALKAYRLSE